MKKDKVKQYARICTTCKESCKQDISAKVIKCPHFNPVYKRPVDKK